MRPFSWSTDRSQLELYTFKIQQIVMTLFWITWASSKRCSKSILITVLILVCISAHLFPETTHWPQLECYTLPIDDWGTVRIADSIDRANAIQFIVSLIENLNDKNNLQELMWNIRIINWSHSPEMTCSCRTVQIRVSFGWFCSMWRRTNGRGPQICSILFVCSINHVIYLLEPGKAQHLTSHLCISPRQRKKLGRLAPSEREQCA